MVANILKSDANPDDLDENEIKPPEKKSRSHPRILDGKYFEIQSIDDKNNVIATCTECKHPRRGQLTSTGNFLSHIRSKHPELGNDVEKYINRSIVWEFTSSKQLHVSAPPTSKEDVCISFIYFNFVYIYEYVIIFRSIFLFSANECFS